VDQPEDAKLVRETWWLNFVRYFVPGTLVAPRRLYTTQQPHWTEPARLLFQSASVIDDDRLFGEMLQARGWEIDRDARFFMQANHSELLEEFFSLTFGRDQEGRHKSAS